jgi:hypothetical protein
LLLLLLLLFLLLIVSFIINYCFYYYYCYYYFIIIIIIIYTHVMERPMGKRGTQILAPQIGIQNWGPPMLTFIPSRFIVRPSEVLPPMSPLEIVSRG